MFATKETAIITAGILVISAVLTRLLWAFKQRTGGRLFEERETTRRSRLTLRRIGLVAVCVATFVGVNVLFYSSFFQNRQGLTDALRSFALWTHTGTRDHVHRWDTYLWWLAREEMPSLALGLVGSGLAFLYARNAFVVFASLWAMGTLLAYSIIPYKTPWLTLNMIVPFAIVGGWAADVLYVRASNVWRRVLVALAILAVSISVYRAVGLNFVWYDDDRYPYVYAHTRRAVLDLTRRIEQIREHAGSELTIAVVSPDQFPLSWYLRDYSAGYYGHLAKTKDPIVIGSQRQDDALRAQLGDNYVRLGSYTLRPGVDLVLYVRRDLATP